MATSPQIVKSIALSGFDPEGEPTIHEMSNGALHILFEFMPPTWDEGLQGFQQELQDAAGLPVKWEDRELFIIEKPTSETVLRIKTFIESYRKSRKKKKKVSVDDFIHAQLRELLAEKGFRLKSKDAGFVRRFPGGRHSICVPLVNYDPVFEFSLVIGIGLAEVERIMHLFSNISAEDVKSLKDSESIGIQLEYFTSNPADIRVSNQEETLAALAEIILIIENKILPFLDKHQDVHSLDKAINRPPRPGCGTAPPYGLMVSVILARLAGNPDFEKLAEKYERELAAAAASFSHPGLTQNLERFKSLVHYLRNNVPAQNQ